MNIVLVGIVVSFVFAGITFIASQNIISSISIFILFTLFFILIARRQINKSQLKIRRYHQCFQFINAFVVSLNVKGSLSAAIQSAYDIAD